MRTTKSILLAVALVAAAFAHAAEVNLTWSDNSTNESGFEIERALGAGAFAPIGVVGANVVTFKDTTLAPLTEYRFRVRAYNAAGTSDYSNVLTYRSGEAPPNAPGTLDGKAPPPYTPPTIAIPPGSKVTVHSGTATDADAIIEAIGDHPQYAIPAGEQVLVAAVAK